MKREGFGVIGQVCVQKIRQQANRCEYQFTDARYVFERQEWTSPKISTFKIMEHA